MCWCVGRHIDEHLARLDHQRRGWSTRDDRWRSRHQSTLSAQTRAPQGNLRLSGYTFSQVFLPHDTMLTRYMLSLCVCPFVFPPQACSVVPEQLNTRSWKQRHAMAYRLYSFLTTKIWAIFLWGNPQWGRQLQARYVKMGDFRLISRYTFVSETVQDRNIVTMKGDYKLIWTLSNGSMPSDP